MRTLVTIIPVLWAAAAASAMEYPEYKDGEIIERAELVIDGSVTAVFAPVAAPADADQVSVARVKVVAVHKGAAKPGEVLSVIYWSYGPGRKWTEPESYKVGERAVFALKRRGNEFQGLAGPAEAKTAEWVNPFRAVYNTQVQAPRFRKWLAVRERPEAELASADAETRAAAIWWAVRGAKGRPSLELTKAVLAGLKDPKDIVTMESALEAAGELKSAEAVEPCLKLLAGNEQSFGSQTPFVTLARIGEAAVAPTLRFLDTCPDAEPRRRALGVLRHMIFLAEYDKKAADARIVPFLLKTLEDGQSDVVFSACQVLWYEKLPPAELDRIEHLVGQNAGRERSSAREGLMSLLKKNGRGDP